MDDQGGGNRKILFLDIDGVLNDHSWLDDAESTDILRPCMLRLNRIVRETGAQVVVSSAWRYMVLGGAVGPAMTLVGFGYMLRTHGMAKMVEIVGTTCPDEEIPLRGDQIAAWLADHPGVTRYVVLDDDDGSGVERCQARHRHPFVRVDGAVGLTDANADWAIAILNGEGNRA